MKHFTRFIVLVLILTSCATGRYQLADIGYNKDYLVEYIRELGDSGELPGYTPLILLNDKLYRPNIELKEAPLNLRRIDIEELQVMDQVEAIQTYGKEGQKGVLIINTKEYLANKPKVVIILLDGKKISQNELKNIDTAQIASINRVTKKEDIKKYTNEKCDSLILITLKKE